MSKLKSILILLSFFTLNSSIFASHILSGNLKCNYLKTDSGKFVYAMNIELYRICEPGSINFPSSLDVCIFNRDNNLGSTTVKALLNSKNYIYNCYGVCVERAILTTQVKLNANTNGYILKTEFCCRADALNLRNDQSGIPYQGYTFECFLKPEYLVTPPILYNQLFGNNVGILSSFAGNTYKIKLYPNGYVYDSIETTIEQPLSGASVQNNYPGCTNQYSASVKTEMNSGYNASMLLGANGLIAYNKADSILTLKAVQAGFYYFTINNKLFKNSKLIYSQNNEIVYNVTLSQLPPITNLNGKKMSATSLKLSWVPDCMEHPIVKNVVLKSVGTPDSFKALYNLQASTTTALDSNLPLKTKLYYKIMNITNVQDTVYSNVLETEMWNTGLNSTYKQQLTVTPNPGEGIFNVNIVDLSIANIQLISTDGKAIESFSYTQDAESLNLNLSDFSRGLYVLQITTQDGRIYMSKLAIEK